MRHLTSPTPSSLVNALFRAVCILLLFSTGLPVASAVTLEKRVAASSDDAEERNTGSMYLNSSDLEMTFDRNGDQTVGIRFTDLGIPRGAVIERAYIQFDVDESNSGDTNLVIRGEDTGSAATFVRSSGNISTRPVTSAFVNWAPPPWTTVHAQGEDQQTPDIAGIVQEIVEHPDWDSGNALAIIITGTGERTAEAYDGTQAAAPLLHVEYYEGEPVNRPPVVEAGQDKVIVLPVDDVSLADASVSDDGLPGATLTYNWEVESTSDGGVVTFDPGADVQNPTAAFSASGSYVLRLSANDGEYSASDTLTVTVRPEGSVPTTLEKRVAASADDAEERSGGRVSLSSSDLELVFDAGGNQLVGMRFTELDIPRGAVIEQAYVQFTVDEVNSGDTALMIQGEYTGSAPNFTSSDSDISSRTRTAASVAWAPPAWNAVGAQAADQQTPDISPVVQEIVDHAGWYSGNALAIIISGTGERTAESYDGSSGAAPLLHVVYSGGAPDTTLRSWSELDILLNGLGIGVDTANKRLFVPLGTGFETPQNITMTVEYGREDQGYALGFDDGPLVPGGGSQDFIGIEYGSTVPVQLYQDSVLVDSHSLLFDNLPVVELKADTIVDEPKSPGTFRLISGAFSQDIGVLNMGIEFRGATSQIYPKKSFSLETRKDDDPTDEKNIEPLGLRKDGDWLLDATYRDTAFVRNIVSHDIFNAMRPFAHTDSLGEQRGQATIRGDQVEVILNESYQGAYIFEERVDRKLLNLDKINVPEDEFGNDLWDQVDFSDPANGSVIYKADSNDANLYHPEDVSSDFEQKYPDIDDVVYWDALEEFAEFVDSSSDEEFINSVADLVDIDNVVDYWLVTNITGNRDTLKKNYYLARNAMGKWFVVPWDYDATFGMYWNGSPYTTTSWWDPAKNNLIRRLTELTETGFNARVKLRWNELRATIFTTDALIARFIAYREKAVPITGNPENARTRNFVRWPESGGEGVNNPELGTIEFIRDWIQGRIEFLDEQIQAQPE